MQIVGVPQSAVIGLVAALDGKLDKTGGTLTGPLIGTSATFNGVVQGTAGLYTAGYVIAAGNALNYAGIGLKMQRLNKIAWANSLDGTVTSAIHEDAAGTVTIDNGASGAANLNVTGAGTFGGTISSTGSLAGVQLAPRAAGGGDWLIYNSGGVLRCFSYTASADLFTLGSTGNVTIVGNITTSAGTIQGAYLSAGGAVTAPIHRFNSSTDIRSPANQKITLSDSSLTQGVLLDFATNGTAKLRNLSGTTGTGILDVGDRVVVGASGYISNEGGVYCIRHESGAGYRGLRASYLELVLGENLQWATGAQVTSSSSTKHKWTNGALNAGYVTSFAGSRFELCRYDQAGGTKFMDAQMNGDYVRFPPGIMTGGNADLGGTAGGGNILLTTISTLPGLWLGTTNVASPSLSNYAIQYQSGSGLFINAPAGEVMALRVNNSTVLNVTGAGAAVTGALSATTSVTAASLIVTGANQYTFDTSSGDLRLRNTSSGSTIFTVPAATQNVAFSGTLNVAGTTTLADDCEFSTIGKAPVIKSPNGTRWRLTASDAGALTLTAA